MTDQFYLRSMTSRQFDELVRLLGRVGDNPYATVMTGPQRRFVTVDLSSIHPEIRLFLHRERLAGPIFNASIRYVPGVALLHIELNPCFVSDLDVHRFNQAYVPRDANGRFGGLSLRPTPPPHVLAEFKKLVVPPRDAPLYRDSCFIS